MKTANKIQMLPAFYEPQKVAENYWPRTALVTAEGQKLRGTIPTASDDFKQNCSTALLIVDPQNDFCLETGNLSVKGAVDDMRRLVEFIYRNINKISTIVVSQDCHLPFQVFFPSWWKDKNGIAPNPFTAITYSDFKNGAWRPAVSSLAKKTEDYLVYLEQKAKKTLVIWPFHCMVGTPGQAIVSALYEAIAFHAAAKLTQPVFIPKGSIPWSEHYSIWEPEMHVTSHPQGQLNSAMLDQVAKHTAIYIGGEAASHCVDESMRSKEKYFLSSPNIIAKFHYLSDCTSPVTGFEATVPENLERMRKLGVKIVSSTDDIN